ncbi:hypothetical protein [Xanthomonas hortorum]|uniref:hypothetical protein n=1 Tax=Xanthomonas hortorum TaxID=56454 RepID=UPI001752CAE4|nr:hypothetical protein [Xanthomonas hortorum]MCE4358765.1 hypothetical protein [Xanthomonas hortorum pv. taraxaci]CAD0298625.1 hypothetical protein NCPPB940_00850 [Xanthomonas hortorum pv. taraxaci]CAD0298628.1 hypothetical protein NCPPB940_00850 [Xanthomonas hortorum pv. taraxaci]
MDRITTVRRVALALAALCMLACIQGVRHKACVELQEDDEQVHPANAAFIQLNVARHHAFDCEQYRAHPHPGMVNSCENIGNMTLLNEVHTHVHNNPSDSTISP